MKLDYQAVLRARETIAGKVRLTPLTSINAPGTGGWGKAAKAWLKLENLQETGAFKIRGVFNKVNALTPGEKKRGVACATSGNHGLGVAYAAREKGIAAVVFVPVVTPESKREKLRALGARLEIAGESYQESYRLAGAYALEHGLTFLHGFDDPLIMAGQGTVALEIMDQGPAIDCFVLPVGGGGLAAGVLTAVKAARPGARVIGVQAEGAPSMHHSRLAGRPIRLAAVTTSAEGIAVKEPGRLCFEIVNRLIDDIVLVSDAEIRRAQKFLWESTGTRVEGAGAAALAALAAGRLDLQTCRRPALIVTGGNISPAEFDAACRAEG